MHHRMARWAVLLFLVAGCDDETTADRDSLEPLDTQTVEVQGDADAPDIEEEPRVPIDRPPGPDNDGVFSFANACVTFDAATFGSEEIRFARAHDSGAAFTLDGDEATASTFLMRPSDLGTFLLYDTERHYLTGDLEAGSEYPRVDTLDSAVLLIDDTFKSPAEWILEPSEYDATRFQLKHYATGLYLGRAGLTELRDAAIVTLYPAEGCAEFPELTLDAEGTITRTTWDDGELYGFVDAHLHLLTNFGFGGGGIFHGSPFHRLGVEHALSSCETFHGEEGRKDVVGYAVGDFSGDTDTNDLINALINGRTPDFNHFTDGYPEFTDWPHARLSKTHQAMYYKWLERAYLGGLRLMVQHATGNSVLCGLVTGTGAQQVRYSCNDMVSVDRQIEEAYAMERYIDALHGGPGAGWFRVVTTPEEARTVIAEGKLAVILGIEISNLFDCFLTPHEGFEACDVETLREKLDAYQARGIRAIFPVHKYDNGFAPGDGHRGVIEVGNFINSGHYSNYVEPCPEGPAAVFDKGRVEFGGILQPRDTYFAEPPVDMSRFEENPVITLLPFAGVLQEPGIDGNFCQKATMTDLGEALMLEMMSRGMIIEVDHLPARAKARAYELLVENEYPAVGSHGNNYEGLLYELGGVSNTGLGRCADPNDPQAMVRSLRDRVALKVARGGHASEGFAFDFNGFAGAPRPRFGDEAGCGSTQENPITYPFTSLEGDITFTEPSMGNRVIDFNTEGVLHIGLLPELIEDARRGGATADDLEPLFRSAEGYIQMWELAESRAQDF